MALGHPWHAPRLLPGTARAVLPDPLDGVRLARWLRPLLRRPGRPLAPHLASRPDSGLAEGLDRRGVDGLLRRVLDRFLAGVVLDDGGTTSTHFAQLLVTSFVAGTPGLPHDGMQALPRQLARRLRRPVRTGVEVEGVDAAGVTTSHGRITARQVVVAADPLGAAALTGLARPATRGVVTEWYSTGTEVAPPSRSRLLHVDARREVGGPVVNTAVVSAAAPSYAPAGHHLVAASALLDAVRRPSSAEIRTHAGDLLGSDPRSWSLVARHEVEHALPAQLPPLDVARPVRLPSGLVVCGDHRDTASIQGALVSGRRAAAAVLAGLGQAVATMTGPVVVVGAGIAGVACARALHDRGVPTTVLDRGHRIGGRMASRRVDGRQVDLGASYFTVDDDDFGAVVEEWRTAGLARPWTSSFDVRDPDAPTRTSTGPVRWAAPGSLRSLVEDLAAPLDVRRQSVTSVGLVDGRPTVDGEPAAAVVLAMPDGQARAVLDGSLGELATRLDRQWEPVLALVAAWEERAWDFDGAFVNGDDVLSFVADDGRRRGDGAPVLVAHSTPGFAARHLEDPDAAGPDLVAAVRARLGVGEPTSSLVKRWSQARPVGEREEPYLLDGRGLGVCGDGWGPKPRVQTAWRSGHLLGCELARRSPTVVP